MYQSQNQLINDLKEAFSKDERLPEKLANAKSEKEIKKFLEAVDMKVDDKEAYEMYEEYKKQLSEDLDEDSLENVTGGAFLLGATLIGGGVAFAIGVYHGMKCKKR